MTTRCFTKVRPSMDHDLSLCKRGMTHSERKRSMAKRKRACRRHDRRSARREISVDF